MADQEKVQVNEEPGLEATEPVEESENGAEGDQLTANADMVKISVNDEELDEGHFDGEDDEYYEEEEEDEDVFDDEQEAGVFTKEDRETLVSAFHLFDADGNGTISAEELGTLLVTLGQNPTEEQVNELLMALDSNENGKIELDEFMKIMEERVILPSESDSDIIDEEETYRQAFRVFDQNMSGKISAEELRSVVTSYGRLRLTSTEAEEMIKAADMDGDGQVNYEEFVKLFVGKCKFMKQ